MATINLGTKYAFPGAQGFGKNATGGRGGIIYHVTSLADTNTNGTLRYGIETLEGPRTIVFDVSGYITLTTYMSIRAGDRDVTILGQTAPEGGITIRGHAFNIHDSNVIIRDVRFAMGADAEWPWETSGPSDPNYEPPPAFRIRAYGTPITDFMFDHCSFTWGKDGNCNTGYSGDDPSHVNRVTVQNSVIAECMIKGYNSLVSGLNLSFYRNLYANSDDRSPSILKANGTMEFVNNVVYNYHRGGNLAYGCKVDYINNIWKTGDPLPIENPMELTAGAGGGVIGNTRACVNGSITDDGTPVTYNSALAPYITTSRNVDSGIDEVSTIGLQTVIADNVGPKIYRHPEDLRIANEMLTRTGDTFLNHEDEVGGYSTIPSNTRAGGYYSTTPDIPETFVAQHGITSSNQVKTTWTFGSDTILNNAGYTAFEMYSFYLMGDFGDLDTVEPPSVPNVTLNTRLAFPGAVGYGRNATGGRGGIIYHVTNLNNSGTGSFRYGVESITGPRIIVFDVSGYIDITTPIKVRDGYQNITILGQTSPDGIVLRGAEFNIHDGNVILRHIKIAPGADGFNPGSTGGDGGYEPADAFTIKAFPNQGGIQNVYLDSLTLCWARDGLLDIGAGPNEGNEIGRAITFANSLCYENIEKGYGTLINGAYDITYYKTLWYSCADRTPGQSSRNNEGMNYVNNYHFHTTRAAWYRVGTHTDFINNVWETGSNVTRQWESFRTEYVTGNNLADTLTYINGNTDNGVNADNNVRSIGIPYLVSSPLHDNSDLNIIPTSQVKSTLLNYAGSRLNFDSSDIRVFNNIINDTGAYITDEDQVGGYPTRGTTARASGYDSIADGIDNNFSITHNITDPDDVILNWNFGTYTVTNNAGYTALEMYASYLAGDLDELAGTTSGNPDPPVTPGNMLYKKNSSNLFLNS